MAQILDSKPLLTPKKIETWAGTTLNTCPVPKALIGVHMSNGFVFVVVNPGLISAHSCNQDQNDLVKCSYLVLKSDFSLITPDPTFSLLK